MRATTTQLLLSVIAGTMAVAVVGPAEKPRERPFFGGPVSKLATDVTISAAVFPNNNPWGGVVLEGRGWRSVTGTTRIPWVSNQPSTAGAAAWVGIDGYQCQKAILQTGVVTWGDGRVQSWYEWWPADPVYYGDSLRVRAGDEVRMTVNATSTRSGTSMLENLTTGQWVVTPYRNMRDELCLIDAECIIEFGGGARSFAFFGEWDIQRAMATDSFRTVPAYYGEVVNVVVNGRQDTDCRTDWRGVECRSI